MNLRNIIVPEHSHFNNILINNQKRIRLYTAFIGAFLLILSVTACGGGGSPGIASVGGGTIGGGTSGTVTLTWDAPTTNEDGTPLNDLGGYKVYYGRSSGSYTNSIDAGLDNSIAIGALSQGTWFFAVTAYDTSGNESGYSNEVIKQVW